MTTFFGDHRKIAAMVILVAVVAYPVYQLIGGTTSPTHSDSTPPVAQQEENFTTPQTYAVDNTVTTPAQVFSDLMKTRNHAFVVADPSLVGSYAAAGTDLFNQEKTALTDLHSSGLHYDKDYVSFTGMYVVENNAQKSFTIDVAATAVDVNEVDKSGKVKQTVPGFSETDYAYSLVNDNGVWKLISATQIYPNVDLQNKIHAGGVSK